MKIIHRCPICRHPQEYHPYIEYGRTCTIPLDVINQQPPEVIVTLDGRGVVVETVTEPGTMWMKGIKACGCGACMALYEEMTT